MATLDAARLREALRRQQDEARDARPVQLKKQRAFLKTFTRLVCFS
jgi:hypothetical protein